jgi:hypothetical protein
MPVGAAKYSGVAIWTQSFIKRVEKLKKQITNLTFIKKTTKQTEAFEKYTSAFSYLKKSMNGYHQEWKKEI